MVARKKWISVKTRKVPVVAGYDVVVIGGGIAGVSAAVAAARGGARACLIEKTGMLGGLATAGLVAHYLPICDGCGKQLASGMAEELLHLSIQLGPGDIPECWRPQGPESEREKVRYDAKFNPPSFALSLDEWVTQAGVDIRFESLFVGVSLVKRCIESVVLEEKEGPCAVLAKTVIDASGDALVARRAGVRTGIETNWITAWYYLANLNHGTIDLKFLGHFWDKEKAPNVRMYNGILSSDITDFYISSRKLVADEVRKAQGENMDRHRIFPSLIPSIAQFRTTQNIIGLFKLDEKHDGKQFKDTIGVIGDWRKSGPVYRIPYRSILPKEIDNLLVVGRCMSATTSGLEIVRAIPACAVTGQAAGVAAGLVAGGGNTVKELDVRNLQGALREQKVIIL